MFFVTTSVNKIKSEPCFMYNSIYYNLIKQHAGNMSKKRCVSPVQWPFTVPIVLSATVCSTGTATLTVQCLSSSFRTDSAFRIQPLFRIRFEPFSVLVYFWVCRKVHLEAAWGFLCKGDEIYSPLREKQRRQGVTELYDESAGAANLSEEVHFFRRVSFMLWLFA